MQYKKIFQQSSKLKIQQKNFKQTVLRILISRDVSFSFETSLKHPAWLRNKDVLVAFSQSVYMCI